MQLIGATINYREKTRTDMDQFISINAQRSYLPKVVENVLTRHDPRECYLNLKYQMPVAGRTPTEVVRVAVDPKKPIAEILNEVRGYLGENLMQIANEYTTQFQ